MSTTGDSETGYVEIELMSSDTSSPASSAHRNPEPLGAAHAFGREVWIRGRFVGKALTSTDAIEIARAICSLPSPAGGDTP